MQIADALSLLALRQLHPTLAASTDPSLAERLRGAGPRLTTALQHALHRAWQTLEVVLAGDAFWDGCQVFLDSVACARLKQQVVLLRTAALPGKTAGRADVLRQACGRELRALRKAGLLTPAGGTGERLAEHVRFLATAGDPARLLDGDCEVLRRLRDELRRVQAPTLAAMLDPTGPGEPALLLIAMRFLLRQEILAQKELAELLPLDERSPAASAPQAALTLVAEVLTEHGRGLQEWLQTDTVPAPLRAMSKSAAQQAQQGDSGSPAPGQATATASNTGTAAAPGSSPNITAGRGNQAAAAEEQKGKERPSRRHRLLAWAMVLCTLSIPLVLLLLLFNQFAVRELYQFKGHQKPVTAVALSADGKRVVSGSLDGTLRVWDAETGEELRQLKGQKNEKHLGPVQSVLFAPEGHLALAVSEDRINLWDVDSGKFVNGLLLQEDVIAQGYFVKGQAFALVFGQKTKDCKIWRIDAVPTPGHMFKDPLSHPVMKFPGPNATVRCIAVSPDGKRVAFGSYKSIHVWDFEKELQPPPTLGPSIVGGFSLQQGPFVAVASALFLRRNELVLLNGHTDAVRCLAFSPDGKRLISGGSDLTLRLWDLASRKELASQKSHGSQVVSVAFAPDGKHVLSGSSGTKGQPGEAKEVVDRRPMRFWEITDPDSRTGEVFLHETLMFEIPGGAIRTLAFSPDGKQVVSGGDDLLVRLWQLPH